ncbi:MAG: hypothetical protein JO051_10025 [Acidobacteriaceae bacterium]|nr:hypothetical protein [Acidobacteriaceae bacterium]
MRTGNQRSESESSRNIIDVISDLWDTITEAPALAWIFLIGGIVCLLLIDLWGGESVPAQKPAGWSGLTSILPWLGLAREISMAAIVAFFLAIFLDKPLRTETITRVGKDIAPFLIAALTVPELRYKMRQICEYPVVRTDTEIFIWIEKLPTDHMYNIRVQTKSRYRNISNSSQSIDVIVAVDDDTNGRLHYLATRPVGIPKIIDQLGFPRNGPQPASRDGRKIAHLKADFPRTDDWKNCYIEGTSEYSEDIRVEKVGRTLIESVWPIVGVEIICVQRPSDVELRPEIPYQGIQRVDASDRWISGAALLPGQRIDLILKA